jgi:hypothetical protein
MKAFDRTISKLISDGIYNLDERSTKALIELLISKGALNELRKLQSSGISIKLNEPGAQRLYKALLRQGKIQEVEDVYRETGIKPKADLTLIETACKRAVRSGNAYDLKLLRDLFGVEIKIQNKKPVNKLIATKSWSELGLLLKRAGSEEEIREVFKKLIKAGEIDGLLALSGMTNIKPQMDENVVQKLYQKYFKENEILRAQRLFEISGIRAKVSAPYLLRIFRQKKFSELRVLLGISDGSIPIDGLAKKLIEKGEIYEAKELCRAFGIKISIDTNQLQQLFLRLIRKGEIYKAQLLAEISGQQPKIEYALLQSIYKKLFADGNFEAIRDLQRLTNVTFDDTAHAFLSAVYFKNYEQALVVYEKNKLTIGKKVPKVGLLMSIIRSMYGVK